MQVGDIVFFNKAKTKPVKSAREIKFTGHGFGIMLGMVPSMCITPPPAHHIFKLLGTCGFLTFDDVAEFLGEDQAKLCIEKFEKKYYNESELKETPAPKAEPQEIKEESKILDPTGAPAKTELKLVGVEDET